MPKKRKLTVIKRRLVSFDNITKMQRCQKCNKPTMNSTGRCAECRKAMGLIQAKLAELNTPKVDVPLPGVVDL